MYALLSRTGSIASSLMSGAIASFGIGGNAMQEVFIKDDIRYQEG